MILASRQPNGKVLYFDARTGNQYKPGRETGRHEGRIPNDVMRFLFPKITDMARQGRTEKEIMAETVREKGLYSVYKKKTRIVPPEKPSLWSRFLNWLKSLINGRN